jgi:hypothetical protein
LPCVHCIWKFPRHLWRWMSAWMLWQAADGFSSERYQRTIYKFRTLFYNKNRNKSLNNNKNNNKNNKRTLACLKYSLIYSLIVQIFFFFKYIYSCWRIIIIIIILIILCINYISWSSFEHAHMHTRSLCSLSFQLIGSV